MVKNTDQEKLVSGAEFFQMFGKGAALDDNCGVKRTTLTPGKVYDLKEYRAHQENK